jgi:LPXTG-motif cell wall-anchored protein
MRSVNVFRFLVLFALVVLVFLPETAEAQCAMCRGTVESNLKNGGTMGRGMNNGIFLILGLPYLIVGTIGLVWYRNRKKENN